jgi:SPFH domain/Band 7 family protein
MIAFIFWCLAGGLGLALLLIAVLVPAGAGKKKSDEEGRAVLGVTGVLMMMLAVGMILFVQMFQQIGASDIGIVISGGRPVGHIGPGYNWIDPWEQDTVMDDAVQVKDYTGASCIRVRIADQQTACANVNVRWKVNAQGVDNVFANYRSSTQGVESGLLNVEVPHAANSVFEKYDPVNSIIHQNTLGTPANPTISQLAAQVQQQVQRAIGSDVSIITLSIPTLTYDVVVQNKINSITTQVGSTVVAQEQEQTNEALAASYAKIAAVLAANPNVLVSQCMTNIEEPLAKQGAVPAYFSCWPQNAVNGTVLPSPKSGK